MAGVGKILVVTGGVLLVVGLILMFLPRIPYLGKLPGDFHVKRDNVEFFFPLATSIVLSLLVSGILWLVGHCGRK
ncbi:MAG TPA: DUF2905 domain-containing protein [Bacteroidota bacterium]